MMPIEKKVAAGTATGAAVGAATWLLTAYVFRSGLPQPVADALPFILAWVGHTLAAWLAPHTTRPLPRDPTRLAPPGVRGRDGVIPPPPDSGGG